MEYIVCSSFANKNRDRRSPVPVQPVDKPFWRSFDKHGGFVKGDGNPPSRYILAKSEYNSDFASQAVDTLSTA